MPEPAAFDWSLVDTVLLDMDGTLLDLRFDNWFWQEFLPRHYGETHGMSEVDAKTFLAARFHLCAGTLDWYCTDYWSRELSLDIAALKESMQERIQFLPGALSFLEQLAGLSKRRVLVTNAHPRVLALKAGRTSLFSHLDASHSTHAFGLPKERREFWPRLAARENFDPLRTLFIDDHVPVLQAAAAFGIAHLRAVRRPDSARPACAAAEFAAIDGVVDLLTVKTDARMIGTQ